jgi:hypothetical protein
VIPSFTRSLETGEPINLEHRVRRADGHIIGSSVAAVLCETRKAGSSAGTC